MPLYEYQCTSCSQRVEVIQKLNDPAPACEKCGGETKKLVSAPAIQFKGSGFYKTDYASGSSKPSESSSSSSSTSGSSTSPETKSESKSETKSDGGTSTASSSTSKPAAD